MICNISIWNCATLHRNQNFVIFHISDDSSVNASEQCMMRRSVVCMNVNAQ